MKTTKELARELGFLRKRTFSSSSCSLGKKALSDQPFKYLIVIDFESTCWQDTKFKAQEIIEFPAVLLNTTTGQVESEFHYYTQPQEHPTLSSFCTELTGITQSKVDEGIPISLCLRKFTHWLDKLYRDKNVVCEGTRTEKPTTINCTCVTWSDWDLGVCLQYECKRKQLLKPPQLNSWIDLRATYRKFYDRKPNGLNGALQDLGIEFQGREHSGVDDARNTAQLAYRMIRDGCVLKTTKTLKTHERSSSCFAQIGANTNQNGPTGKVMGHQPDIRTFTGTKKTPVSTKRTPQKTAASAAKLTLNKQKETPKKVEAKKASPSRTKTATPSKNLEARPTKITKSTPPKLNNRTPPKSSKNTPSKLVTKTPSKMNKTTSPKVNSLTPSKFKNSENNKSKENYMEVDKTPVNSTQSLKRSQKRKLINTPVKVISDKSSNSPCRKVARKVSPRKLTVDDIYKDPEEARSSDTKPRNDLKSGLKVCDMNIISHGKTPRISPNKHVDQQKKVNGTISFKPNPGTGFGLKGNVPFASEPQQSAGMFKAPLPVGKSPRRSVSKAFVTSTPANQNLGKKTLIQGTEPSPITSHIGTSGQKSKPSNLCNNTSSFTTNKTPSRPNQTTNNSTSSFSKSSFTTPSAPGSRSSFVTPSAPGFTKTNSYSNFGSSSHSDSAMKATPPLCNCGRRAKRRMVQSPGQNMGRFFFSCAIRHSVASKTGCDFFKWESSLTFNRSSSDNSLSKQFTPVVGHNRLRSTSMSGYQKRNLGVRSTGSQKVFLR